MTFTCCTFVRRVVKIEFGYILCVMYTVDIEHIHMAVFGYCLRISNNSETSGTSLLFVCGVVNFVPVELP